MAFIDSIKELVLRYPEISVSDNSGILSLHYSECDSYSDYLKRLNDESLLICDDDYEYVVDFLQNLNNIVPICVVCTNEELDDEAYRTHFAPIKGLMSERSITYCDGLSNGNQEGHYVILEILTSRNAQAQIERSIIQSKCVLFSFIYEKESEGTESKASIPESVLTTFKENTKSWPRLNKKLPYQYLYSYVPKRFQTSNEAIEVDGQRRLIYSFKNGKLDWKDSSALNIIATEIEELIFKTFESDNLPFLTWFCIPPTRSFLYDSTPAGSIKHQERFLDRFGLLSDRVCTKLKMRNGIRSVVFDDIGCYSFNSNDIKGANIILFDDLITTGNSAIQLWRDLEREGANVLCFICLEKTFQEDNYLF